jgi:hypothetical protein
MGYLERCVFAGIRMAAIACCFSLGAAAYAAAAPGTPAPKAAVKPRAPAAALPDKTKDDPAKVAAARAFVLAYHPQLSPAAVLAKVDEILPRMIAREKDDNPKLDVKKFEKERRAQIIARQAGLLEMQAHLSSRHFTLQELKDLQAFFAGPVGKKLIAETPNISREMMQQQGLFLPVKRRGITVSPDDAEK